KGVNIAFHIIGDRALEEFLDGIERFSNLQIKIRAEHLQVVPNPLLKRLMKSEVIFSLQPCHYFSDRKWARKRLGNERFKSSYLLRSLINKRKTYLFGTDFPIEPVNPKRTIRACIKRNQNEEIPLGEIFKGMEGPSEFKKHFKPCLISFKAEDEGNISGIGIKYINGSR
ncbi:MAG: amidohydrolase family protein, partial [Acidobacteria bacterium]|nr:amidohydrolase family protein [Acidobacteriota bacterium]